ncbi:MAG: peroxiredoxin family protein [Candidatus Heimdallarchaeota archaeon]|nr:peroxiredoxin family protein [Candidatus Heimdallarchaeota archaeon]
MTEEKRKKLAIIAGNGTLDKAYPPLIIASTAAAMDFDVAIFFTFYGLNIIDKKKMHKLKVPSLANPGAPMPIPNIIGGLPGMTGMATMMMKSWMNREGVATVPQLIEACIEGDVKLIGCQMTMDVMGVDRDKLIDEVEIGGAATFLEFAADADITLNM